MALPQNTGLTLAAHPDHPHFGGWGGDCAGTGTFSSLLLDGDKECTVEF